MDARREERPFKNRIDAGRRLAARLEHYRGEEPLVLALPRGGVPVGFEVARSLGAPLDVFISRKLGAPGQPELGIGAVAQGGMRVLNEGLVRRLGIPEDYLEHIARREQDEVERRLNLLRGDRPRPRVRGRTVIVVDDGLATGVTALCAIEALKMRDPRAIVLAVPVCAAPTAALMRTEVDCLISIHIPDDLYAIGLWYEDFEQVPDEVVIELLRRARDESGNLDP